MHQVATWLHAFNAGEGGLRFLPPHCTGTARMDRGLMGSGALANELWCTQRVRLYSLICVLCTMTHCLLSGLVFHTSAVNWLRLRKSSETPRGVALFFGGDNPTNSVNTTAASEGPDWCCWGIIHSCYRFVWSVNPTSSPEVSNWFCVSVDIRIIVFFLGMIELQFDSGFSLLCAIYIYAFYWHFTWSLQLWGCCGLAHLMMSTQSRGMGGVRSF